MSKAVERKQEASNTWRNPGRSRIAKVINCNKQTVHFHPAKCKVQVKTVLVAVHQTAWPLPASRTQAKMAYQHQSQADNARQLHRAEGKRRPDPAMAFLSHCQT